VPWSRSRPGTKPVYRTPEYRATVKRLWAELRRNGHGTCAEVRCVMSSRLITPAMRLHACHDSTGTVVLGLGHAQCNLTDAAKRARARQTASRLRW
jgi:hypothetical protein